MTIKCDTIKWNPFLIIPTKKRPGLIDDINKVIGDDIKTIFRFREVIKNDSEIELVKNFVKYIKSKGEIKNNFETMCKDKTAIDLMKKVKEKEFLLKKFKRLSEIYKLKSKDGIIEFFNIVLDIKDYILGGTLEQISKRHEINATSINIIAKMLFQEKIREYEVRFFYQRAIKNKISLIAQDVLNLNINANNFSNLLSPLFQKMLSAYYEEKGHAHLFRFQFIDLKFAEWVNNIPDSKIKRISDDLSSKFNKTDLLELCFKINKNDEILKYIVYCHLRSPENTAKICKKCGKSKHSIRSVRKLLLQTYPSSFYKTHENKMKDGAMISEIMEERDKKISYFIKSFADFLLLDDKFILLAIRLKNKLLPFIGNTKENIIAATVCSLLIITLDLKDIALTNPCKHVGTTLGTVDNRIKNNIFKRLNIKGFQGLKHSSELIKTVVNKMACVQAKDY